MGREPWPGLYRLLDRQHSLADLRAQGLHLLAADRWRSQKRPIPGDLALQELAAAQKAAGARAVLRDIRAAYDGRLLVLKGPEVAALYPSPELRPSFDLDLIADDAEKAQRSLVAAGFIPMGEFEDAYYVGLHHLRPLQHPTLP